MFLLLLLVVMVVVVVVFLVYTYRCMHACTYIRVLCYVRK